MVNNGKTPSSHGKPPIATIAMVKLLAIFKRELRQLSSTAHCRGGGQDQRSGVQMDREQLVLVQGAVGFLTPH